MEWLLLAAAGAVVSWIVEKELDRLLDAWRARSAAHNAGPREDPARLSRQRLRRHFWYAAIGAVYSVLLVLGFAAYAADAGPGWYIAVIVCAIAAVLYARSARRRWRRWRNG